MKDDTNYNNSNWYTSILNGIASALGKFVSVFKHNGLIYTALVMVLFICFYTLVINPIRVDKIVEQRFETIYQTERQKEAETINRRLQADEIVGDIMTRMIDKFPAIHRCLLLEAHNSLKSLQNVDFLYYSCTMEMLTPNSRHFTYLSEDLQRQMRVNLIGQNMVNTLKHRDYIFYDSIAECKHPDHRLIHKLANAGDSEAIIIPFTNESYEPVILLVISGDELPVSDIVEYVSEFRKQIESCLM